jgi:DNA-binding transcriptional LysR family regulator
MQSISLADLEAFAAVARHRSFRRAAVERAVSPSLISQTVRRLEERLGVRLLNRTTRSVMPTQAGEELLAGLAPAFAGIAEAVERVNSFRETPSGTLRINAPRPAAYALIAPVVADFLAAYPGVDLEIAADDALIDIVAAGFDAGVRFGESIAQDMIAVSLGPPQRMIVIASPAHLERHGCPREPGDLIGRNLIRLRFPNGVIFPWELEKEGRSLTVVPNGRLTVNDPELQLRAALDGAGFAFMFENYVRPALASGRLVSVLDDWCPAFPGPFLYYSSRRHVPAALRAFIDFVRDGKRGAIKSRPSLR